MSTKDIIGWIATVFSIIVFAGPAVQFYKVLKGRLDFEEAPTVLISTMYCNCLTWFVYGDYIFSQQMQVCNFIGCCFSLLFIIIYLTYEVKKYTTDAILNALIILPGTWVVYHSLIYTLADPISVGKICAGAYLITLLYRLYLIYRVIREKNYRLISYVVTGSTIISGMFWGIFGIFENDYYIIIPYSLAVLVGIAEIVFSIIWKVKYPTIDQAAEASTIGIEATRDDEISKRPITVEVKIDDENDEKGDKIKAKPVKIATENQSKEILV